jgi:hypothetical protein
MDKYISWLYVRLIWGKRCKDFELGCVICRKWAEHDYLFNGPWSKYHLSVYQISDILKMYDDAEYNNVTQQWEKK